MTEKTCPACGSTDVDQVATNWRCRSCESTKPMTLDEIAERKTRGLAASAAMLATQAGHCAACGQGVAAYRDSDRDTVLCGCCYFLIEGARERHGTPALAANWLRAAARYLATTDDS